MHRAGYYSMHSTKISTSKVDFLWKNVNGEKGAGVVQTALKSHKRSWIHVIIYYITAVELREVGSLALVLAMA